MNSTSLPSLHRNVLLVAGLIVIAAGLHVAAGTVNLVLVSVLVAMSIGPLAYVLEGRGMRHAPAVAVTVLTALVGGVLLIGVLAKGLSGLQDKLPVYQEALSGLLSGADARLMARGINVHQVLKPDPAKVVEVVRGVVGGALGALGYSFFALILVAMILAELPARRPDDVSPDSVRGRFDEVGASVRRFVGLTGAIGAGQALVNLAVMLAVGTDFPVVWAVLFFLLNFVPFGFILGMIPPLIVTLLGHGATRAGVLLVVTFAANLISDNVVKPKVMGAGLGLSPLVIILSLMAWSFILGPVGAILAVPLTITLTTALPHALGEAMPDG